MQRLFEAAFRPSRPSAPDGKNFAILPQQSQDELIVSSVHSKLDRVLLFLQRDIGYVLLDDARPQYGGGVRLQQPPAPLVDRAAGPRGHRSTRIPKGEPRVDEEETKQVIRFSTETAKYAQYPDDLVLVWRFTNMLATCSPEAEMMVKQETLYKTVLQGIRLMHLCSYDYSDLVLTLAYASVYFRTTCENIGHTMSHVEAAHVCVLLMILAHCFVIDETCPLRYWQKYIFKRYCTLKVLDAALFRVFQMRDFKLRISEEEEKHALSVLLCAESGRDVILSINEGADARLRALHTHAGRAAGTGGSSATAGGNGAVDAPATGANHKAANDGNDPGPRGGVVGTDDKSPGVSNGRSSGSSGGGAAERNPSAINGHSSRRGRGGSGSEIAERNGGAVNGHDPKGSGGEEARARVPDLSIPKGRDLVDGSSGYPPADRSGSSSTCTTATSSRDETTPKVPSLWSDASQLTDCRAAVSEALASARSKHVHVP